MSFATDLVTFLLADATLSGLISTRLHPLNLPQSPTLPAVSYQMISGQRFHSMEGVSDLSGPRIQFTAWDDTYLGAEAVFKALRERLDGFKGLAGSTTIRGAFFENERDLYEPEPKLYGRSGDFFVYFNE